jgi:hypothetical protein
MRNTFLAPGKDSLDDMIRDIDYGLYAKRMGGGSVSPYHANAHVKSLYRRHPFGCLLVYRHILWPLCGGFMDMDKLLVIGKYVLWLGWNSSLKSTEYAVHGKKNNPVVPPHVVVHVVKVH